MQRLTLTLFSLPPRTKKIPSIECLLAHTTFIGSAVSFDFWRANFFSALGEMLELRSLRALFVFDKLSRVVGEREMAHIPSPFTNPCHAIKIAKDVELERVSVVS